MTSVDRRANRRSSRQSSIVDQAFSCYMLFVFYIVIAFAKNTQCTYKRVVVFCFVVLLSPTMTDDIQHLHVMGGYSD